MPLAIVKADNGEMLYLYVGVEQKRAALAMALFELPARSRARRLMAARARDFLGRDPAPADVTLDLTRAVYPDADAPGLRVPEDADKTIQGLTLGAAGQPSEFAVFDGGRCVVSLVVAHPGVPYVPAKFYARYAVDPAGAAVDASGYEAPELTLVLRGGHDENLLGRSDSGQSPEYVAARIRVLLGALTAARAANAAQPREDREENGVARHGYYAIDELVRPGSGDFVIDALAEQLPGH